MQLSSHARRCSLTTALGSPQGRPWWRKEQISTDAAQGRRGIGTRLLGAVLARGEPVTLITFRDIPWYARHGFTEPPVCQWGSELSAEWQKEIDAGLHQLGPRLVMLASPARPPEPSTNDRAPLRTQAEDAVLDAP
jgi:hypothetical protein